MSFITPLMQQIRYYGYKQTVTNSTATLQTTVYDMTGFESITLLAGRQTTDADTSSKLFFQTGTASDSLGDVTGQQSIALTNIYLEMVRPGKRFVQGNFKTTASGVDTQQLIALLSGAKNLPTTQPASTTGKILYSPTSGNASA